MKWLKELLSHISAIVVAPISNIITLSGILFLIVSFINYNKTNGLTIISKPNNIMLLIGAILIIIGIILFLLAFRKRKFNKLNLNKGIELKREKLIITIKLGEIQSIPDLHNNSAIVLPANTTFIDDCAIDKRTAMGSFILENFPDKISELPTIFKNIISKLSIKNQDTKQYPPGTTFILSNEFSKPARVIITASTTRDSRSGIISSPDIIYSCVKEIFSITANERIDTLFIPILGSGHGGIDKGFALLFQLFSIIYFCKYYHHISKINIIIHPKDYDALNLPEEIVRFLES